MSTMRAVLENLGQTLMEPDSEPRIEPFPTSELSPPEKFIRGMEKTVGISVSNIDKAIERMQRKITQLQEDRDWLVREATNLASGIRTFVRTERSINAETKGLHEFLSSNQANAALVGEQSDPTG